MSKAVITSTTGLPPPVAATSTNRLRRALLTGSAAAVAAMATGAVASAGTAPTNSDADLIALCAVIVANHAEMDRYSVEFEGNDPPHIQARIRVLVDEGHRVSEQVADMRAATMDGTKAKAQAMLTYMGETWDGDLLWSGHDELLAWSIARDLLGEA